LADANPAAFELTWTEVLWGLVSFLGMSIGSIAVVALLLVKLPATKARGRR
jgi:hypothetical protein